ncbi:unnamed protein product [Pieris macdunnoughi]|uniref:Uncharacterized protein n=1 Tax=Pieris macdunnoughi TaxID=345717 RepID=A0A821S4J2_9NEOP|nr:unnamed protein product [Pieris macdunnoughi]
MKYILILVLLALSFKDVFGGALLIPGIDPASTTTKKPWTTKIKNGLGTIFQGAAAASVLQQAIHNGKSSKQHNIDSKAHKINN